MIPGNVVKISYSAESYRREKYLMVMLDTDYSEDEFLFCDSTGLAIYSAYYDREIDEEGNSIDEGEYLSIDGFISQFRNNAILEQAIRVEIYENMLHTNVRDPISVRIFNTPHTRFIRAAESTSASDNSVETTD